MANKDYYYMTVWLSSISCN